MKTEAINLDIVENLCKEPQNWIDSFALTYTNDSILTIKRKRVGTSFFYYKDAKRVTSKRILKRIKELVIPPNWTDVKIASKNNAHIQAIGRDGKNRKQYKYHPSWEDIRNKTKFFKMAEFGKHLPNIRKQVEIDLLQESWTKSKILALVVKLLEETHIRIGNEQYAKRNKTYGLTTLRSRHLQLFKDKIRFKFIGKRGKLHKVSLKNKRLIKLVNQCEEIPGWELFKYFDTEGQKKTVDSGMVNDYLHTLSGSIFTAKDYRTWNASIIVFEVLKSFGIEKDESKNKKNRLAAIDEAKNALGNTRSVLKKYYLHPHIDKTYKDHSIVTAFNISDSIEDDTYFSASEKAMLQLIKGYSPDL